MQAYCLAIRGPRDTLLDCEVHEVANQMETCTHICNARPKVDEQVALAAMQLSALGYALSQVAWLFLAHLHSCPTSLEPHHCK